MSSAPTLLDTLCGRGASCQAARGGDLFVDSSVHIGRAFHIPRFVIGGTLVSLATTTPELVVSVTASVIGDSGIAVGNAIGSCICNIGLIVGMVALITSVTVDQRDFANRAKWMVGAAVLVVLLSWDRTLVRPMGVLLVVLALTYLWWDYRAIRRARAQRSQRPPGETAINDVGPIRGSVLAFAFGAGLIIVGSRLLVSSGQSVAAALGIPSAIIGFSVVAVGTSLPELVTGVAAARKGVPDLSLGNIVGANVLNLFLIVGLSGSIRPLTLDAFTQWYAFPWMGTFFAALIILIRRNGMVESKAGVGLLVLYILYLVGLIGLPALGLT